MNYYTSIQDALNFIEQNLFEHITIQDAADHVGFSSPHFYRIFSAVTGSSFSTYLRNRRVSEGLVLLKQSDQSIGRIAFEIGFDSHEVFIRSFKKVYGISPRKGRRIDKLPLFERFNIDKLKVLNESGVIHLKTNIIMKDSFNIIGESRKMNQAEQVKFNLIDEFLTMFKGKIDTVPDAADRRKVISMYEYDPTSLQGDDESIDYLYTLGLLTESSKGADGYEIKTIPTAKYALFVLNKESRTLNDIPIDELKYQGEPIESVYDYIDGVWLLTSGYELSGDPDFELRDLDDENIVEYYISVK